LIDNKIIVNFITRFGICFLGVEKHVFVNNEVFISDEQLYVLFVERRRPGVTFCWGNGQNHFS